MQAKVIINNSEFKKDSNVLSKPFVCLDRCVNSKVVLGYDKRINSHKLKKFKFVNANCEIIQD